MVGEVLVGLNCRTGRLYVDGTVGAGGHATVILDQIGPEGELWGLDRDPNALQAAAARLAHHTSKFQLFHRSYAQLGELLEEAGSRGSQASCWTWACLPCSCKSRSAAFLLAGDEPLDMRFNPEGPGPTAATWLNRVP